ncbi:MAG: hypothetical protein WBF56_10440 [Candidatus Acidiferrales bacterium]
MQLVIHFHFDIGFSERAETGGAHGQFVNARWQREKVIGPIRTRNGIEFFIGLDIRQFDLRACDHALRGVAHHALYRTGYVGTHGPSFENHCGSQEQTQREEYMTFSHHPSPCG